MAKYLVWDSINGSEEHASKIDSLCAEWAAERYAEDDHDGQSEGLYSEPGHPIRVKDKDGNVSTFNVVVDYDPNATASLAKFESVIAKEANHG